MTTSSAIVDVSGFTTDAKFRAWGSAISAAIVAAGLTVTADTGQVNWATVTRATAANTKQGYEIYRFNDSLQSTSAIYFRIDYGSGGSASGANMNTWLTVGTGSDGVGNITGTAAGMTVTQGGNTTATASDNTSLSVGAAYSTAAGVFTLFCGFKPGTALVPNAGLWVIARSCDTSGVPTSAATVVYRCTASNAAPSIICNLLSPATNFASRNVGCANFGASTTITAGTTVAVHKHYIIAPIPYPTLAMVTINTADAVQYSLLTVAPFGSTTHKYLALPSLITSCDAQQTVGSVAALFWE